jgi:hypothetical protein
MQAQPELDFDAREEQRANLARVSSNIARIVADFCRGRFYGGRPEFRMADLTSHVNERSTIAPDSAGRILRDLRRRRVLDYRVVNRAQSLYEITGCARD